MANQTFSASIGIARRSSAPLNSPMGPLESTSCPGEIPMLVAIIRCSR
jgi:hypothetical protein